MSRFQGPGDIALRILVVHLSGPLHGMSVTSIEEELYRLGRQAGITEEEFAPHAGSIIGAAAEYAYERERSANPATPLPLH